MEAILQLRRAVVAATGYLPLGMSVTLPKAAGDALAREAKRMVGPSFAPSDNGDGMLNVQVWGIPVAWPGGRGLLPDEGQPDEGQHGGMEVSNTRPVLFLGGPLHGQVRPIPLRSHVWRVAQEMPSLADMGPRDPPDSDLALEPVEYLVEKVTLGYSMIGDSTRAGWVAVQEKDKHDAFLRWLPEIESHLSIYGTHLLY